MIRCFATLKRGARSYWLTALAAIAMIGLMPATVSTATMMPAQLAAKLHLGDLRAVTCLSTRKCTAVGAGLSGALAETWNGTKWGTEPMPPSPGTNTFLSAVSCTSATACTAVGQYSPKSGKVIALTIAERWNGKKWTHESTPNPAKTTFAYLLGVSCSSATACTAVGGYAIPGKPELTLAERWNGKKWTIESTPIPNGFVVGLLSSVSCKSATVCIAVGNIDLSTGALTPNPAALAESWNGRKWVIQPVPNPKGTDDSELNGVSCIPAMCTAVGQYVIGVGKSRTLAEQWNGKKWAVESAASPKGSATFVELDGVSCTSAKACSAVGHYQVGTNVLTLAEGWNGTKWVIEPTPKLRIGSSLYGVSCKATRCVAVGFQNIADSATLAEVWNGKKWAIQP